MRLVDRRQRGAEVDRREPARVAVGQHLHRLARARVRRARSGGRRARRSPGSVRRPRPRSAPPRARPRPPALGGRQGRQSGAHAVERPAQVHGGRARRIEPAVGVGEMRVAGVAPHGQREAVRAGHADQRRAPHDHRADGVDHVVDRSQHARGEGVRQAALVDDLDRAVGGRPERAEGDAVDLHAADSTDRFMARTLPATARAMPIAVAAVQSYPSSAADTSSATIVDITPTYAARAGPTWRSSAK